MKRTPLKRKAPAAWSVPRRRAKFGNIRRVYEGVEYHSMLEARYAAGLDLRIKAGGPYAIKSWRRQVPVKLEVNGNLICRYIVDFVITHLDDHEEWIECKGFETETWKLKDKLFRALFPDRLLTVVR